MTEPPPRGSYWQKAGPPAIGPAFLVPEAVRAYPKIYLPRCRNTSVSNEVTSCLTGNYMTEGGRKVEVRVLLVDDSGEVLQLLRRIVEEDDEITLVGEARNGQEAVEKVRDTAPDVVVMDVQMPIMSGVEATKMIKDRWPDVSVLGCTSSDDRMTARAMARAGASAYIDKTKASSLLVPLVKAIGVLTAAPRVAVPESIGDG